MVGRVIGCAASIVIFVALSARPAAAQDVDATIPPGKALTPFGLIDKECVFEMPHGARLESNGDVTSRGSVVAHHKPCSPKQMEAASSNRVLPPGGHDWAEYTNAWAQSINGVSYFDALASQWTVPSNPSTYMICTGFGLFRSCYHAVLYYFPSFESSTEIIQPVLSWGDNGNYGGASWSLSSWYWSSSAAYYSPPVAALAGDTIQGTITMYDPTHYEIVTTNVTHGGYTYLDINTINSMDTVQSGALEVYTLLKCIQLPTSSSISFSLLGPFEQAGPYWNSFNPVSPDFSANFTSDAPSCNWSINLDANGTTSLGWTNHL